jgi:hypothetical protein
MLSASEASRIFKRLQRRDSSAGGLRMTLRHSLDAGKLALGLDPGDEERGLNDLNFSFSQLNEHLRAQNTG